MTTPRYLVYAARTYERNELTGKKMIYSPSLVKIPVPEFYVLYNGRKPLKETTLKLSDAFMVTDTENFIELTVKVIDINFDRMANHTALIECQPLHDYSYLIEKIREYKGNVPRAINDCLSSGILTKYLEYYGSEVVNMLNIEYNAEEAREYLVRETRAEALAEGKAEGKAEGRAEGKTEGILMTLAQLFRDGILTLKDAADRANMSVADFELAAGLK